MNSIHDAVDHIGNVMGFVMILHLFLPLAAWGWINIRREADPSASVTFGKALLWLWLIWLLGAIAFFFSGRWYAENGGDLRDDVIVANIVLAIYLALYVALVFTLRPSRSESGGNDAYRPLVVFAAVAAFSTLLLLVIHGGERDMREARDYSRPGLELATDARFSATAALPRNGEQVETFGEGWFLSGDVIVLDSYNLIGTVPINVASDIRGFHVSDMGGTLEIEDSQGRTVIQVREPFVPHPVAAGERITVSLGNTPAVETFILPPDLEPMEARRLTPDGPEGVDRKE